MKILLAIGSIAAAIILLLVFLIAPAFAEDSGRAAPTATPSPAPAACRAMHQTCQNGDAGTVIESCQRFNDGADMPCLDQGFECPHQEARRQAGSCHGTGRGMMWGGMMRGGACPFH